MGFDLDELINRLLRTAINREKNEITDLVKQEELMVLCQKARDLFMTQSTLIEVEPPITICGDVHGQYSDLLRIFNRLGYPPNASYLFMGDYVDRGRCSIETISLLFAYKLKFPGNFFLLRGNHECAAINRIYGFYEECYRKYSIRLWQVYQDTFNCMPFCGLVGGRILCMHGGLSPKLNDLDQIRRIRRPIGPPVPSMALDLLWSDPMDKIKGWKKNSRGVSYVFGADVVKEFCENLDIDLVARAHQVVQDGYEFFASRKMVTVFSAPRYCGEFDNSGAVMNVDPDISCSFSTFKSIEYKISIVPKTPEDDEHSSRKRR